MLRRRRMLLGLGAVGYYAGALALLLFCYWYVGAQDGTEGAPPTLEARFGLVARTPHCYVPAAFGAAVILATALGCRAARRGGEWPHWPALVSGIGETGFLASLIFAFLGMPGSIETIVKLGPAVTPAYLADGFAVCFGTLTLGPGVLLLSLAGATVIRAMSRPAA